MKISRGPDGKHLDAEGVRALYAFFANGGTAYGAKAKFGLSYGGARHRYDIWASSKAAPPKLPVSEPDLLTTEERATLAAALPIIQKVLNALG